MARLGLLVATCGYVGYAPIAPGTFGSAAGLVLYYVFRTLGSPAIEVTAIAALFVLGVWGAGVAERALGTVDPGPVVIDEVVGMLMTLALLPLNGFGVFVAFLLFRLLDVVKPWPAARLEHLHGGLGVMADDAVVGIYGNLVLRGLMFFFPVWFA